MRNSFALLAVLTLGLLLAPRAEAQVDFGIRAGINVSNFSGDIDGTDAKIGLLAGPYVNYAFSPTLSVQPELLFSQKGAREEAFGDTFSYNVTYLDIPVLIKYSVPTGSNLRPSVYAGPQLSILLSESYSDGDISVEEDFFSGTDFGLAVGADIGAQFAGRTQEFGVGLRYTLGLSNAVDSDLGTIKNNVFSVTAYFTF